MKWLPKSLALPLLVKELVEQAARRRTYSLRVAYAVLLFLSFGVYFYMDVASRGATYELLGIGRRMFVSAMTMQFVGIYLFMPAMASGTITSEKERRSLELLFITDLGPWEIVVQKLVGKLVPMFTFLLLALPLMAISYSFGGVSAGELAAGTYLLFITSIEVGAFAVAISAYYRTSAEALLASYTHPVVFLVCVAMGLGLAGILMGPLAWILLLGLVPPAILAMPQGGSLLMAVLYSAGVWFWTGLFVYGARKYLVTRAFLGERKRKPGFIMALEGLVMGTPRARGRERRKRRWPLPGDDPVAWREVTRTLLGTPRHFAKTAAFVSLPVLLLALMVLPAGTSGGAHGITALVMILWFIAVISVAVPSSGAVARERANQTLDLLLTTPLTGSEIVRQKAAVARRRTLLVLVPFLVLFLMETWWEGTVAFRDPGGHDLGPTAYLVIATLSVLVFLPEFSWVSRWIGLRARNRLRAAFLALGVLFIWIAGPFLLVDVAESLLREHPAADWLAWLYLLSPAVIVGLVETAGGGNSFRELFGVHPAFPIAAGFALHGAVLYLFRRACLDNADRYLGRPAPGGGPGKGAGDSEDLVVTREGSCDPAGGASA